MLILQATRQGLAAHHRRGHTLGINRIQGVDGVANYQEALQISG
jgi:hypothetical protein